MMECKHGTALNDEQLSAFIDGVADHDVAKHLATCPACATRLEDLQRFEQHLSAQLSRWDCPTSQQLANYHWGLTSRSASQAITRHLESCVRCSEEIETLRVFLNETVPQQASSPTPVSERPVRFRFREFIATLLPRPQALAVRGDGHAPMVAEVGDTTIVLDVQSIDAGKVSLLGQLATDDPDRWTGALVEVRQAGALRATAEVDDVASFQCTALPAAMSDLRITAPDGISIVLPHVELKRDA